MLVACDLMKSNMKYVPLNLISEATERLRDKKVFYVKIYEALLRSYSVSRLFTTLLYIVLLFEKDIC